MTTRFIDYIGRVRAHGAFYSRGSDSCSCATKLLSLVLSLSFNLYLFVTVHVYTCTLSINSVATKCDASVLSLRRVHAPARIARLHRSSWGNAACAITSVGSILTLYLASHCTACLINWKYEELVYVLFIYALVLHRSWSCTLHFKNLCFSASPFHMWVGSTRRKC